MMCEHLPMIFSSLLNVDDKDLLQPKRELDQVIPLEQPIHFSVGPVSPHVPQLEPVLGIVHEIL